MAPIILYRIFSDAWLRVESRIFFASRTVDNDELGLVRHAISFKYLNRFTSRFFSLTEMTLGYLKWRLGVDWCYDMSV